MAATDPWLRFYVETLDDEKLDMAAEMVGCDYDTVFTTWLTLLAFAKRSPVEGHLLIAKNVPLPEARIAKKIRRPNQVELVHKIIDAFDALDMVGRAEEVTTITHWPERQYKSDTSTPRVQSFRRSRRGNGSDNGGGNVSPSDGGNGPESEQNQNRTEADTEDGNGSDLAGDLGVIQSAFIKASKFPGFGINEKALKAFEELRDMGATPTDIEVVINQLREKYGSGGVTGPWSIVTPMRIYLASRAGPLYKPSDTGLAARQAALRSMA